MVRPFKFTRAIAPALFASGGLCAAAMATTLPGSPPRVAAPCSPDGVCLPRVESWGFYETRWRPFPGDAVSAAPTQADQQQGPTAGVESLGGPQPPTPSQEGLRAPERRPAAGGAAAPGGAVPGGAVPGGAVPGAEAPAGGGILPPVDVAPAPGPMAPPAAAPGTIPNILPEVTPDAAPGAEPDPLDPFGAAPSPPNWMVENAAFMPLPAVNAQPAVSQPPAIQDGPNLHGDDAPPTLPPALQGLLGSARAVRPVTAAATTTNVALQLPASVRTSDLIAPTATPTAAPTVMQASAQVPLGIQLINPATAVTPESGAEGLQQAIYFEASDQDQTATPLPPVQQ